MQTPVAYFRLDECPIRIKVGPTLDKFSHDKTRLKDSKTSPLKDSKTARLEDSKTCLYEPSNHQAVKLSNHRTIKVTNHGTLEPSSRRTIEPSNPLQPSNPTRLPLGHCHQTSNFYFDIWLPPKEKSKVTAGWIPYSVLPEQASNSLLPESLFCRNHPATAVQILESSSIQCSTKYV